MLRLDLGLHFLCLFLILLKRGACRDWFVSPSKGLNDEYCGTETHPCETYTYVIQTKWVEGGLSVLLECGHNNTYNECVPDRPNGQPGGVAITFPPQGSSLHMSTWGNCSEDHAYIDCQKQGSAFWFYSPPEYGSTVVLKNIVFVNGSTAHQVVKPHGGSALTVSGYVALTLENVSFYGNYNESSNVSTANAKPSPVVFIEHVAQSPGFSSFVSQTLRGCVFQNNSNGVHVSSNHDVIAVVEDSTFLDNVGLYSANSLHFTTTSSLYLNIRECHFESNLQLQNGSVVNIQSGRWSNISVVDVSFVDNRGFLLSTATNTTFDVLMGVVLININHSHVSERQSRSSIRFEMVNLSDNYFPNRGGGVDIRCYYGGSPSSMDVVMDNVYLKNNTGFWHGGGVTIMTTSNTLVLVRNSTFIGNKALGEISYGGAMYISGSRTVIESCTFVNNSALTGTTLFLDEYHDTCDIKDSVLQSDLPKNATSIVHSLSGDSLRLSNSTVYATKGFSSPLTLMTREPLVPEYKPQLYIALLNGSKVVCPVKYNSIKNITMPFAHINMFQCYMCPRKSYTLDAAQMCDHASTNETYFQCLDCPGGGYCYDGDLHARHNNWCQQVVSGNEKRYVCIACKPHTCCSKFTCVNPQSCSGNREGTACSQCKVGYSFAFRLFYAIAVTDKCYSNELLEPRLLTMIICIISPFLLTTAYFGWYLCKSRDSCKTYKACKEKIGKCPFVGLLGKCKTCVSSEKNAGDSTENKEKARSCSADCARSTLETVQRIASFFYPAIYAYEVSDGVFPHTQMQDINFSIIRPPTLTQNESEAAFQLLGLLFFLPAFTCVFIVSSLLYLLCKKKPQTKNKNFGIQGGHGEGEASSGNRTDDEQDIQTCCLPCVTEARFKEGGKEDGRTDIKGTFLYICVKQYFSLWRFLYGFICSVAFSIVMRTYAERGLNRKFIDDSPAVLTNPLRFGFIVTLIALLGIYSAVVMYLLSARCKKICKKKICKKKICRKICRKMCRNVICFYIWTLLGLPTLPLTIIMLVMSCFKCGREKNCHCPSTSLMTCITTVFDEIAEEGRSNRNEDDKVNEQEINKKEEEQITERESNKNGDDQMNKQRSYQNDDVAQDGRHDEEHNANNKSWRDTLRPIWEGCEMLFLFVLTMLSKLFWYDQAIKIPTLISLSAVHLMLVSWTRPLRSPEANTAYVSASLVLVIVGALNAIQVGDFGTGHPLGISKEVLDVVNKVQFGLFLFPVLCLGLFILYYLYILCCYICKYCKKSSCCNKKKTGGAETPLIQHSSENTDYESAGEAAA